MLMLNFGICVVLFGIDCISISVGFVGGKEDKGGLNSCVFLRLCMRRGIFWA